MKSTDAKVVKFLCSAMKLSILKWREWCSCTLSYYRTRNPDVCKIIVYVIHQSQQGVMQKPRRNLSPLFFQTNKNQWMLYTWISFIKHVMDMRCNKVDITYRCNMWFKICLITNLFSSVNHFISTIKYKGEPHGHYNVELLLGMVCKFFRSILSIGGVNPAEEFKLYQSIYK